MHELREIGEIFVVENEGTNGGVRGEGGGGGG